MAFPEHFRAKKNPQNKQKKFNGKNNNNSEPDMSHISRVENDGIVHAVIISPTQELALQTLGVCETLCQTLPFITVGAAIGGLNRAPQESVLKQNTLPAIIVATPGRLIDLLLNLDPADTMKGANLLRTVRYCVLDEADKLLEQGFRREMEEIMQMLPGDVHLSFSELSNVTNTAKHEEEQESNNTEDGSSAKNTKKPLSNKKPNKKVGKMKPHLLQTLLFTATMSRDVAFLAKSVLYRPVVVYPNGPLSSLNQAPPSNTQKGNKKQQQNTTGQQEDKLYSLAFKHDVASTLVQEVILVESEMDKDVAAYVIARDRLQHQNSSSSSGSSAPVGSKGGLLIFCNTRNRVHRLSVLLRLLGIPSMELHGGLSTAQRLYALDCFKAGAAASLRSAHSTDASNENAEGEDEDMPSFIHPSRGACSVLVSTDLAARGLYVSGVGIVLSYDQPRRLREHIHRAGRTARIGHAGRSITLVNVTRKHSTGTSTDSANSGARDIGEYEIPELLVEMNRNSPGKILRRTIAAGVRKEAQKAVSNSLAEKTDADIDETLAQIDKAEQRLNALDEHKRRMGESHSSLVSQGKKDFSGSRGHKGKKGQQNTGEANNTYLDANGVETRKKVWFMSK